jgi:hypothetical protein
MRLPARFPHSRHEQYLMALPDGLLSRAETREKIAVMIRARSFYDALLVESVAELMREGCTDEDIVRLLTGC